MLSLTMHLSSQDRFDTELTPLAAVCAIWRVFVRILHRRGMAVKVIGIHPNVYHLLLDNREKPLGQNGNPRHALSEENGGAASIYA